MVFSLAQGLDDSRGGGVAFHRATCQARPLVCSHKNLTWPCLSSLTVCFLKGFESYQVDSLISSSCGRRDNPNAELFVFIKTSATEKYQVRNQTPGTGIS